MQAPPAPTRSPIFLDESGRRRRRFRWTGRAIGILFLLYVALVVASLARAPFVRQLSLPGIGPSPVGPAAGPPALGGGARSTPAPDLRVTVPASPSTIGHAPSATNATTATTAAPPAAGGGPATTAPTGATPPPSPASATPAATAPGATATTTAPSASTTTTAPPSTPPTTGTATTRGRSSQHTTTTSPPTTRRGRP